MTVQMELKLLPAVPNALSLNGIVLALFKDGGWWTFYELQHEIQAQYGQWHSDSGISARKRDLSKAEYGGWQFEKRIRANTKNTWEYRLI